jgi:hypothetical protein
MADRERPERDFKGVWIPREIWLSTELSLMEKVLFVEIHSLDNERGCFASNHYFAEFFGLSERQIATYVSTLKKKGFVSVSIVNYNERTIRVTGKYAYPNANELRKLRRDTARLADGFRISGRVRPGDNFGEGMKETAWGVGRNLHRR